VYDVSHTFYFVREVARSVGMSMSVFVSLWVCSSVCLTVCSHISKTVAPSCDTLGVSGFVYNMFSHSGPTVRHKQRKYSVIAKTIASIPVNFCSTIKTK